MQSCLQQNNSFCIRDEARGLWLLGDSPRAQQSFNAGENIAAGFSELFAKAKAENLLLLAAFAYEAAGSFDPELRTQKPSGTVAWIALYDRWSHAQYLPHNSQPAHLSEFSPACSESRYRERFAEVQAQLQRGNSYQVNLTFPFTGNFKGDPFHFFCSRYRAQEVSYAAYLNLGEQVLASLSPELFFSLRAGRLITKPMKGTARRGRTLEEDNIAAANLRGSEKNRAENVMILDMMRNDLSRIAREGSVQVTSLCEVERYRSVLQMTSTVEAETEASLPEVFAALFPCASVTGAPKAKTMDIIRDLEMTPRGFYAGSIGFFDPMVDCAQFNVAIRTAIFTQANQQMSYHVGSGIVADSDGRQEYAECLQKAAIIKEPPQEISLFETMRWEPESGYLLLDRHLERLERSARYFNFCFDKNKARALLASRSWPEMRRVKLSLRADSELLLEDGPVPEKQSPVRLAIAAEPVDTRNVFLFHKTSSRSVYEEAKASTSTDFDDVLLWNEQGEITETTIANIAVYLDNHWYTPTINSGLLGGVLRAELLSQGKLRERPIMLQEIRAGTPIARLNALRGWEKAVLQAPPKAFK